MDVDCDGVDFQCKYGGTQLLIDHRGNQDGQPSTSFAVLDATKVPWVVIPESLFEMENVPPNAISAVICNGKMFYGVMGDTDGDNPEVIGEASELMAHTCFPNEGLNGGKGHSALDVLCKNPLFPCLITDIVFNTEFNQINETAITDFAALRKLGDQKMEALIMAL